MEKFMKNLMSWLGAAAIACVVVGGAFLSGCGSASEDDALQAIYDAENLAADTTTNVHIVDTYDPNLVYPDVPAFTGQPDGDYGSASEAWVSDLYHGKSGNVQNNDGVPCYSASAGNGAACIFPQFKQVNITFQGSGSACTQHRDYILSHGGTLNEYAQIILGIEQGFTSLSGIGTGVLVKENNTAGTNMTIRGICEHAGSELGEYSDTYSATAIVNLPAVQGVDPGSALNTVASSSSTFLAWSPENIWDYVTRPTSQGGCGMVTVTNPQRIQLLRNMAYYDGEHEALHMFGFSHFKFGLMAPFVGCNPDLTVPVGFGQALGDFSGGAGTITVKTGSINPTNVP